jgi:hypothetical protein
MNAKPSISRKTFLRMPNQIQRGRKSYDTPDRDALALYGQVKVEKLRAGLNLKL